MRGISSKISTVKFQYKRDPASGKQDQGQSAELIVFLLTH